MIVGRGSIAVLCVALICASVFGAEGDGIPVEKKSILPRVPSRATISKTNEVDARAIAGWVRSFIAAKERKAETELAEYKKVVLEEERVRAAEEANRLRRQERNDLLPTAQSSGPRKRSPVRIQLDFQVPEITTYRLATDALVTQQKFSNDIVDALSRMDRNNDGKLTDEEFKEAAALVLSTGTAFVRIDGNGDGMIAEDEIEALRRLPPSTAAAIAESKNAASASNFKLKPYDVNGNGMLEVDEHKALIMAYVDAALRSGQDAQFYRSVADNLVSTRAVVAEKFADIEIAP